MFFSSQFIHDFLGLLCFFDFFIFFIFSSSLTWNSIEFIANSHKNLVMTKCHHNPKLNMLFVLKQLAYKCTFQTGKTKYNNNKLTSSFNGCVTWTSFQFPTSIEKNWKSSSSIISTQHFSLSLLFHSHWQCNHTINIQNYFTISL